MGRGAIVVAAALLFATSAAKGVSGAHSGPVCGPAGAKTLAAAGGARVFTREPEPAGPHSGFAGMPLDGCLASTGRVVHLSRPPGGGRVFGQRSSEFGTPPIALNPPWVAFAQSFHGIDTSVLTVALRNLRTGKARYCAVGYRGHPRNPGPELTDLVLKGNGDAAYIVKSWNRSSTPWAYQPTVGDCVSLSGREAQGVPLEIGEGVDAHSLRLEGSTLTWVSSGQVHAAPLR